MERTTILIDLGRAPVGRLVRAFFLLLLGSIAGLAAAPVPARPAAPPDIQRILDRGELVVAIPGFDFPPYFAARNGVLEGADIDLAQGLAQALGVKLRFDRQAGSFDAVVDRVVQGKADVGMGDLSRTLVRERRVRFSDPYLTMHHALALNRLGFARLAHGRDLAAVLRHYTGTLGVPAGTSWAEAAARFFPAAKVVLFQDWTQELPALERGDLVAVYADEFTVDRMMASDPRHALILRPVVLTDLEDTLGLAVPPASTQLLELINLYLAQRVDKLTLDELLDRARTGRP